jgi:DSF synthase
METLGNNTLPLDLPPYNELICHYDPEHRALWYYLNPKPRPCATRTLATEVRDFQIRVATYLNSSPDAAEDIQYLVLASANPSVFNLGGDLELFVQLITEGDRDRLYEYGRTGIDVVYHNWTNLGAPALTTISLVQGAALGGGFEGALSSNVLIAEERAQMGFPEILFNLFPGMGAYSLLVRRIEPVRAERLLRSGQQYGARELRDTGVVDVLASDGEGVHAVNEFIRRRRYSRRGQLAIQRVRQVVNPLTYQELLEVVEIWVEAALRLTERDIRLMTQIVAAQYRVEPAKIEAASRRTDTNKASVHALAPPAVAASAE